MSTKKAGVSFSFAWNDGNDAAVSRGLAVWMPSGQSGPALARRRYIITIARRWRGRVGEGG